MWRALLFLMAACELQPVNEDTGTLTKLRVLHIGDVAGTRATIHIVDKTANPKNVHVQAGIPATDSPANERATNLTVLEEGDAVRLDEALWSYEIDLQPYLDAGHSTLSVRVSDGEQSDLAAIGVKKIYDEPQSTSEIVFGDEAEDSRSSLAPLPQRDEQVLVPGVSYPLHIKPITNVRWWVSQNAILTERKAPSTRLELLRAKSGERVFLYSVTGNGVGGFRYLTFIVQ